ncbi:MAG: tetratricopeptide repeat protein [Halioglobus sp.]|nr:tetratricopeptide repeat protein [Halioglobus sp.]
MLSSLPSTVPCPASKASLWSHVAFVLCTLVLLPACAADFRLSPGPIDALTPLVLDGRLVESAEVVQRVSSPDLLALDSAMTEFVRRYTQDVSRDRARLITLHSAISGAATLGIRYDPQSDGTAQEVFHRGTANCLAYASLFVALAREAGLNANYQWLDISPAWTRDGERVAVRLHINVVVKVGRNEQFMVDIDPLQSRDIAGSRQISDRDALALYHSNSAMRALSAGMTEAAWLQAARALQLSPATAHLWVNLGAIYRSNGQYRAAERSYLYALQLDPQELSAMNNLVVLYKLEGRNEARAYWEEKLVRYRDANPFYHAWLGDEAAESGEWRKAVSSYQRALGLLPGDSRLLGALGRGYEQLGEVSLATGYVQRAIEAAQTRSDSVGYQRQLDALQAQ